MSFQERTIDLPAGVVTYHAAGDGHPVLHFHGGGGFRQTGLLESLAEKFSVWAPVAPGFDGTDRLDGVGSIETLAQLWGGFADTVIGRPCHVMGHSSGGRLAIWFAVLMPEKIDRLILEAPSGFCIGEHAPPDSLESLKRALFAHPEKLLPEAKSPDMLARNRDMIRHYWGGADRPMFGDMDNVIAGRLHEIKATTLILYGDKDGAVPIASVQFLEQNIRHASLVTFADAAHAIEIDQPEAISKVVTDFLSDR